jgi:putative FmdB family regulatory protein
MPLYEYRCKTCGHEFERMLRFAESNVIPHCPECESQETEKKISVFSTNGALLGNNASGSNTCSSSGGFS